MERVTQSPPPPHTRDDRVLAELHAMRAELSSMREMFDAFFDVLLNSRFPYGQPTDRWKGPQ